MILLENEHVKAAFETKGAELKSLFNKETALEYLWDSDPRFWAKSSPVLFPIVGGLRDNAYVYQGQTYHLSRHGFARDQEFDVEKISDTEVCFSLQSNTELKEVYPFDFNLTIRYQLQQAVLTCTYEVYNPSDEPLLFSIGAHPAFKVPLTENANYEQYYLQFNEDRDLTYHKIKENLINTETASISLVDGQLPLRHSLFIDDALVFKNLKSDQIDILNYENGHGIRFRFGDFPYFGIWAAPNASFVCLEPWCGIADGVNHDGHLETKEGVIKLTSKTLWRKGWNVLSF